MSKRDLLLKEWASQVICFLSIHRTNGKDQLYYRITVDHLKGLKGVGEVKALRWKWGLVRFLQEVWLLWKSCLGCCVCVCVCMWTYWESCRQFQQHFDLATWASRFSKFTTNVNKINILESHLQILDFFFFYYYWLTSDFIHKHTQPYSRPFISSKKFYLPLRNFVFLNLMLEILPFEKGGLFFF